MSILEALEKGEALLMRVNTFVDMQKRIESLLCASAASVILHEVGRECGKEYIRRLSVETKLSGEELLRAIIKEKEDEKWGKLDFSGISLETRTGIVKLYDSFEARKYGPSPSSICHFIRGFIAGILYHFFGQDIVFEETLCLAKGDKHCEFKIQTLL